jgi:hypothetical protein
MQESEWGLEFQRSVSITSRIQTVRGDIESMNQSTVKSFTDI